MNILFVNYGDFTANSLNHIGPFAARLQSLGHACVVAVPSKPETITAIPSPGFKPATHAALLAEPRCFPDGRAADIVHAWTPRENVRAFVTEYVRHNPARVVVHLEDNEVFLTAKQLDFAQDELGKAEGLRRAEAAPEALSHPLRHRMFLKAADAATVIVPTLRDFVPAGLPCTELPPGIDFPLYQAAEPDPGLRASLKLRDGERVIVFTGSNTFANEDEMRELYHAVALLNERGCPTRLVRTGLFSREFRTPLPPEWLAQVTDLGFIEKQKLPGLLALADAAVQPGRPGPFNDYRLPSKLPELLAMGVPTVLPATNVGLVLKDGVEALVLPDCNAKAIADACERLFRDPALGKTLRAGALAFARAHYDLGEMGSRLETLYRQLLATPARPFSLATIGPEDTESSLFLRALAVQTNQPGEAALLQSMAVYVSVLEEKLQALREQARLEDAHEAALNELTALRGTLAMVEQGAREREALTAQHVANLEGMIRAHSQRIGELDAQCTHLDKLLRAVEAERAAEIANLEDMLKYSEARRAAMERSLTWRATAWLRWLGRKFGR